MGYSFAPSISLSSTNGSGGSVSTTTSQGVGAIIITDGGTGYTSAPTVGIVGGGGSDATAVAEVYDGKISKVTITNPGFGYSALPTVTFTGDGSGEIVEAVLTDVVDSLSFDSLGRGYTAPPIAVVNGSVGIADIIINDSGEGFTTTPTITISGGGGNGCTAVATVADSVRSIIVTNQGSGYTSAPTVAFSGGGGTNAEATAVVTAGRITSIVITNRGSGYTTAPTISFTGGGGSGAAASAVVASGLVAINITNPGIGYSSLPTITVGSSGSRKGFSLTPVLARATVSIGVTGSVSSITLLNSGLNYTGTPTVNISGGNGTGASAYAKVIGRVTSITIDDPGTNYSTAPKVTIFGGEGTGATGVATVSGGQVTGVTITNGGNNYVLTKFASFPIGTILVDQVGNQYTVMSAKTNRKQSSLIVQSNAGFPIVGRMKLRKFQSSDYFVTNTALSQKYLESRFPTACYKVTGSFDINNFLPGTVITKTDQTNGDKYFNVISSKQVNDDDVQLLLQPTNGGDINNNVVLTNGASSFTVKSVIVPELDIRTGEILMISNSDIDFTQNQDQSLSFRTIINF
jgi:hypothetical protein